MALRPHVGVLMSGPETVARCLLALAESGLEAGKGGRKEVPSHGDNLQVTVEQSELTWRSETVLGLPVVYVIGPQPLHRRGKARDGKASRMCLCAPLFPGIRDHFHSGGAIRSRCDLILLACGRPAVGNSNHVPHALEGKPDRPGVAQQAGALIVVPI